MLEVTSDDRRNEPVAEAFAVYENVCVRFWTALPWNWAVLSGMSVAGPAYRAVAAPDTIWDTRLLIRAVRPVGADGPPRE